MARILGQLSEEDLKRYNAGEEIDITDYINEVEIFDSVAPTDEKNFIDEDYETKELEKKGYKKTQTIKGRIGNSGKTAGYEYTHPDTGDKKYAWHKKPSDRIKHAVSSVKKKLTGK